MPLTPGTRLGPYEIAAPLGAGSMGEVYKARDTRLNRMVAIKVSNDQFSERFQREAQAVAALNHSNVCTLHDVGPNYLVMEYIEGTPLKGPLPMDQTLKHAVQICEALEAAHKKGITHRDLKPANILVTKNGVKLLDFGLAKMGLARTGQPDPTSDATLTMTLTGKNEILGTVYYMSPEQLQAQATGRDVDARSDIFSFGLVLYEMLTGKRAFEGASPASVIAAIIERRAPSVADVAPPALDRVLKKCLAKDPDERWQTVRDLRDELKWIASSADEASKASAAVRQRPLLLWVALAVLALVAAGASWIAYRATRPAELKPLVRLDVDLGHNVYLNAWGGSDVIISPDGTRIAYLSRGHIFTRKLDQPSATELSVTQGATSPFFSPDGQWIAFFAVGKMRKISVEGGTEIALCDAGGSYTGADWGEDGNIIASLSPRAGLFRVPSAGGTPVPVTELQGGERTHRWPQILPGGKVVLFTVSSSLIGYDDASIDVVTLADHNRRTLQRGATFGRYLPGSGGKGYLTYVNRGTLFAVPFDLEKLETSGSPIPVLQQVSYSSQYGSAKLSFSRTGTLVYRSRDIDAPHGAIQWLDADGKTQPLLDKPGIFVNPRLSPDGDRLAVADTSLPDSGIWIYDLHRDTLARLTTGEGYSSPVWAPDGKYVVFRSPAGIFWTRADGGGKPEPLVLSNESVFPTSFSPDGKRLAFHQSRPQGWNLWTVSVERGTNGLRAGKPEPFLQTPFVEFDASFSSDGHWLAYSSSESGNPQIYVRAFPDKGGRWQISSDGGTSAIFSRNGRELFFYSTSEDRIMVVSYSAKVDTFVAEKPRVWSEQGIAVALNAFVGAQYDVAPNGKRIATGSYSGGAAQHDSGKVIFLENFVDELKRRVPRGGN